MKPITDLILDDVDCVIEFGSGWGRNIYYIIDKLKRKDIDYYALEYTKSGCNTSKMLTNYIKDYKVYNRIFDYNKPVIKLEKKYKNIVIFTRHSIEQVKVLKEDFFHKLLELESNYTVIHQEPIGWQITNKKELNQEDKNMSEHIKIFNTNLYKILMKLKNDKKIIIDDIKIDYCSYRSHTNAATLIICRKNVKKKC